MDNESPLVKLLKQIRFKIFERLQRGELQYERDLSTLYKHLQIATEMGNPLVVGQTHNLIGIIESRLGHFEAAEKQFLLTYDFAQKAAHPGLMSITHNNLGEMYRRMGDYEKAIDAYETAKQVARQSNEVETNILAESNQGLAWLALNREDEAEICFRAVLETAREKPWDHLSALVQALYGMGEVCLAAQEYEQAWHYTNEAERLAAEREHKLLLAQCYLTKAHVAAADARHAQEAADYYRHARDILRLSVSMLPALARTLMDEARYQQRHQQNEAVLTLAREALSIFRDLRLEGDVKIAESLIRAVEEI